MSFVKYFIPSRGNSEITTEVNEQQTQNFPKVDSRDFVSCSLNFLPEKKVDFDRLKLPLVCAVTPIPYNDDSIQISHANYDYEEALRCSKCGTVANSKSIVCPDRISYLCNICNNRCQIGPKSHEFLNSAQMNVPVVQFPYESKEKADIRVKNVLIVEKSDTTVENGLFDAIVKKFIEKILTLNEGLYSFFVITTGITIPSISSNRSSFRLSVFPDATDAILNHPDTAFFDLSTEKDLFIKCIYNLSEVQQASVPFSSVFDIISSVTTSFEGQNVFSTMVTCTADTGDIDTAKNLGSKLLITHGHFDLFCMNPSPQNQPNYTALSEFSMLNNSHLTIFNSVQVENVVDDIIYRTFCKKSGRCLVLSSQSTFLSVTDIKGCGMRRTENSFILTAVEPGDTVYFMYDYALPNINTSSPSFSFQMRMMKNDGGREVRSVVYSCSLARNMAEVMKKGDYNTLVASFLTKAIEAGREYMDVLKIKEEAEKIRKNLLEDSFVRMMFCSNTTETKKFTTIAIGKIRVMIDFIRAAETLGRTPQDIASYLAPIGYALNLDDPTNYSPLFVHGAHIRNGGFFIQYDHDHSVVLLAQNEDAGKWSIALTRPPLSDIIKSISTARSIELIHPVLSKNSRVYDTINKCINGN